MKRKHVSWKAYFGGIGRVFADMHRAIPISFQKTICSNIALMLHCFSIDYGGLCLQQISTEEILCFPFSKENELLT